MFELVVAAKMLLTAPQSIVGNDRATIQARFGSPDSVATDFRKSRTTTDRIVTLNWPQLRIRLYERAAPESVSLLGVTTTADVLKIASPVHIGVDRGTVLRELGGPIFEDEDQIVYSLQQDGADEPNPTVRIVFRNDHVVGFDWTFPIADDGGQVSH